MPRRNNQIPPWARRLPPPDFYNQPVDPRTHGNLGMQQMFGSWNNLPWTGSNPWAPGNFSHRVLPPIRDDGGDDEGYRHGDPPGWNWWENWYNVDQPEGGEEEGPNKGGDKWSNPYPGAVLGGGKRDDPIIPWYPDPPNVGPKGPKKKKKKKPRRIIPPGMPPGTISDPIPPSVPHVALPPPDTGPGPSISPRGGPPGTPEFYFPPDTTTPTPNPASTPTSLPTTPTPPWAFPPSAPLGATPTSPIVPAPPPPPPSSPPPPSGGMAKEPPPPPPPPPPPGPEFEYGRTPTIPGFGTGAKGRDWVPPGADYNVNQYRYFGGGDIGPGGKDYGEGPPTGETFAYGQEPPPPPPPPPLPNYNEGWSGRRGMGDTGFIPPPDGGITIDRMADAASNAPGLGPKGGGGNEGDIVQWVANQMAPPPNVGMEEDRVMNPLVGGLGAALPVSPLGGVLPPFPFGPYAMPGYGLRGLGVSPGSMRGTPTVTPSPATGGGFAPSVSALPSLPSLGLGGVRQMGGLSQGATVTPQAR